MGFMLFVRVFLHWSMFLLYLLILPTSLFRYYENFTLHSFIITLQINVDIYGLSCPAQCERRSLCIAGSLNIEKYETIIYDVSGMRSGIVGLYSSGGKSRQKTQIPPTGDYFKHFSGMLSGQRTIVEN